jgi:hypothetical protein
VRDEHGRLRAWVVVGALAAVIVTGYLAVVSGVFGHLFDS